jgi:hypothetical protein
VRNGHAAEAHVGKESLSHTTSGGPPPQASGGGYVLSLAASDRPWKRECPRALFWEGWQEVENEQQCGVTTTGTRALFPSSREIPTIRTPNKTQGRDHTYLLDNAPGALAAPLRPGYVSGRGKIDSPSPDRPHIVDPRVVGNDRNAHMRYLRARFGGVHPMRSTGTEGGVRTCALARARDGKVGGGVSDTRNDATTEAREEGGRWRARRGRLARSTA